MKHYKFKGSKFNYSAPDKKDVEKFMKRLNSLKPIYFPFVKDLKKKKVNFEEMTFVIHLILNMMKYGYNQEIAFYEVCADRVKRQRVINSLLLVMNKKNLLELGSLPKQFFWDRDLTDIDFDILKLIDDKNRGESVIPDVMKFNQAPIIDALNSIKQSKKKKK